MKGKKSINRHSFESIATIADYPNLLEIQTKSYESFLQAKVLPEEREDYGLQAVFNNLFPISDSAGNFELQFVEFYIDKPKYNVRECQERGVSYALPIKAKMRLAIKDVTGETDNFTEFIEQDVYLGNMPYMTARGTFIINGAERVVVSQLHRSPGVFFSDSLHPNGTPLYSARIIPFRGSWVEFTTDVNDVMYVYIDRKKKFPVTMLLRAIGFSTNEEIIELFGLSESVKLNIKDFPQLEGRPLAADVVDTATGEVIAEIGKERIRRVIKKIKKEQDGKLDLDGNAGKMDLGFKVFKLQESNFKIWRTKIETEEQLVEQLQQHLEPLDENAKTEDVLYELLLKSGVSLTAKIEQKDDFYLVNDNEIALILEKVDKEIINSVIDEKPQKVITIDRLFNNNDQLKTNTALQMKDAGIEFKVV